MSDEKHINPTTTPMTGRVSYLVTEWKKTHAGGERRRGAYEVDPHALRWREGTGRNCRAEGTSHGEIEKNC